jgi:TP901 family phage tail tape measure protein
MEDLKLGKTLEDGTSLGNYASSMAKVGVNIKDTNGALKDMDVILNELGERWATLAKDEQIALAQGVAGIRQYNQFIALMDNWDVMEENVDIAREANGVLEQQFKIYKDSAVAS